MRITKILLASALACAFSAPGAATPAMQNDPATIKAREQATNLALLGGLIERRVAIARAGETESNRAARDFLDRRIAELRSRLGN